MFRRGRCHECLRNHALYEARRADDEVHFARRKVTTRTKLEQMNGAVPPGMIARTHDDIVYREKQRAFALLDFDTKGMPPEVAAKIKEAGGFFEALITVSPSLRGAARVTRASTSDDQARFGRQIHANKKRTFV
jgi:hypothetical protein